MSPNALDRGRGGARGGRHLGSDRANGGSFEKRTEWKIHLQRLADAPQQASGQQRMSADLEEVVVQTDAFQAEDVGPDRRELDLEMCRRLDVPHIGQRRQGVEGEPVGEPETLACRQISEMTEIGIGSGTAPTTCIRPRGARVETRASQSSWTLVVTMSRSIVLPSLRIASESRVATTWWAPKLRASSNLAALEVNAVTSQP